MIDKRNKLYDRLVKIVGRKVAYKLVTFIY